jgi:hypothetical protein
VVEVPSWNADMYDRTSELLSFMSLIIDPRMLRVRSSIAGRGIGLEMLEKLPLTVADVELARDGVEVPLMVV